MQLGLNINIWIRQVGCASGVFLAPSMEDNVGHSVSDVQIQMTIFIEDHELIIAHYLPWNPCKPKISGVKRERSFDLKYQLR